MQNIQKIEKIFKMLGSPNDNECLNALNAIKGILKAQNKNFSDLSNHLFGGGAKKEDSGFYHQYSGRAHRQEQKQEQKSWQDKYNNGFYNNHGHQEYSQEEIGEMVAELDDSYSLTEWEEGFISSIAEKRLKSRTYLTPKQLAVLVRIYKQYTGKERP